MSKVFVLGYDPGGKHHHGLAIVEGQEQGSRWKPISLRVDATKCLQEAITWVWALHLTGIECSPIIFMA